MTDKQLPPLPTLLRTRVVDGVPCISVSEHEYQMREYALQAIAHATQPAEVTDEQIESSALEAGFSVESNGFIWAVDGYVGTRVDPGLRKFARAILALHPVQVPMNNMDHFLETSAQEAAQDSLDSYIRSSITAQAKKEDE